MANHPSKEELSGFLLGQLPSDSCEIVAEHVEQCPPCQQTIHDLEALGDTLVEMLRKPDVTDDDRSKQVIERVVAVVQNTRDGASQTQNNAAPQEDAPTNYTQAQLNIPPRAVFEKALKASGAIDDDEWTQLRAQLPEIDQARDAAELAKVLVQHGALTKFQATLLYQGKSGLRMGEYIVLDQIGAGGMGQVFKARHRRMDRVVAIKVLAKSAMNSPEAVKRFQREVKAAAKLSHPNIVHAYDAGEQDGVHFLVMEYVAGHDLSGLIKQQGPLPLERVTAYVIQAARGLAFAHSKGVVHRDIKPANLLLDTDGTVKILDMGLARIDGEKANLAALDGLTQSGQVMGTVDYMAPEQAFDTRTADAKADVYSLGCTVYRLLTGRNAYDGETLVQKILAHREQPIPTLSSPHGVVTAGFDGLYRRMMAKKPEDRPTMSEVVTELEALQKVVTVSCTTTDSAPHIVVDFRKTATASRPAAGSNRGRRPPVKHLAVAAGAAALLFLGVWIIVRDKDGNELAKFKAPDGASVTVTNDSGSKVVTRPIQPTVVDNASQLTPYEILTSPDYEWSEPENLGPNVNSGRTERFPALSGDGLTLVFCGIGSSAGTLKMATRPSVDVPFGPAELLGPDFMNGTYPTLSADGLTLVYVVGTNLYTPQYDVKNEDLWQATRRSPQEPFSASRPLAELNSPDRDYHPSLSVDGLSLLFRSRRRDAAGECFLSRRPSRDAPFAAPIPFRFRLPASAPSIVNTYDCMTSSDDRVLLFVAKALNGGEDVIWQSTRPKPGADFGPPTMLLVGEGARPALSADGSVLIFYSNRPGGDGERDLWQSRRVRKAKSDATPSSAAPPPGDYALRFDGNSIVDLKNLTTTNYPSEKDDITLEAYVTPEGLKVWSRIVGSERRAELKFEPRGANASWEFRHSAQGNFPRSPVTPNRRVHVAGVRRNNENFLFVDGKLVSHLPDAPLTSAINQRWSIGEQLVGIIDEVRISNTARYSQDFIPAARFETDDRTTALYHFDEGAGDVLRDASGNGADGKIIGATWVKADGMPVNSQPSANDRYALVPTTDGGVRMDSLQFDLSEPFTMEGYISPATYGGNSICMAMGNGRANLGSGPKSITFAINRESRRWVDAQSSKPPVAGTLVHVAGVWTTEEAHLYVNGMLEATVNLAGEKPLLGRASFSLGNQFNGLISEVRVSRGIRYRGQQFTPEKRFEPDADTLALYHFDEGMGDVLKDSSGNNHHGKIIGAKWVRADGSAIPPPAAPGNVVGSVPRTPLPDGPPGEAGTIPLSKSFDEVSLAMLPNGRQIVVGSDVVQLFDLATGKQVWNRPTKGTVGLTWVAVSRDGSRIAVIRGRIMQILQATDGAQLLECEPLRPNVSAVSAAYSPDGRWLAAGYPATISLWDATTGKVVHEFKVADHLARNYVAFSPDGARLVSASEGTQKVPGRIVWWNPTTREPLPPPENSAQPGRHYSDVCFSTDGKYLIAAEEELGALIYDVTTGKQVGQIGGDGKTEVDKFAPVPGGKYVVCAGTPTLLAELLQGKAVSVSTVISNKSQTVVTPDGRFAVNLRKNHDHLDLIRLPQEAWTPEPATVLSGGSPGAKSQANATLTDPAFQQWLAATQTLPADKQLEAVRKKLVELNPDFDGKFSGYATTLTTAAPKITDGVVTELGLVTDQVVDLSPVRALGGLKKLNCSGSNPGKGRLADLSPLAGLKLTTVVCSNTRVADLSPLAGMPLNVLACNGTPVTDLAPLAGMSLVDLRVHYTGVSDLSPLKGMKIGTLYFYHTPVSDLTPLTGMPLTSLNCSETQVSDLSPLKGTQLTYLWFHDTPVSDVAPLAGMPLKSLRFTPANITRGIEVLRAMTTLKDLGLKHEVGGPGVYAPDEFWKKYDAGEFGKPATPKKLAYLDPAFQQWIEATQKLPAEQQLEAVRKKLVELNPDFDGKVMGKDSSGPPKIEDNVVTEFGFTGDKVSDLSPVRVFVGLKVLFCGGHSGTKNSRLTDLSPLEGMSLTFLNFSATNVARLEPLAGMPLRYAYFHKTSVADLSPLENCPTLSSIGIKETKVTPTVVAALQAKLPNCKIDWDDPAKPPAAEIKKQ